MRKRRLVELVSEIDSVVKNMTNHKLCLCKMMMSCQSILISTLMIRLRMKLKVMNQMGVNQNLKNDENAQFVTSDKTAEPKS